MKLVLIILSLSTLTLVACENNATHENIIINEPENASAKDDCRPLTDPKCQ